MVLFVNIKIGQFVEVRHKSHVLCGTVRYKGHLNGEAGEWVGVELEYPLGKHNGCWRGREYFKCPSDCGLFTHACNIRFRKGTRRSRDTYRKVRDYSSVDESLFHSSSLDMSTCYSVSKNYVERAKTAFSDIPYDAVFTQAERYPLSHSIGRNVPAASMLRKPASNNQVSYKSRPVHHEYARDLGDFMPRNSSIPHYMMPHEALMRQMKRGGWESFGLHRPRFISV
ncbi:uncharacterized protein LOC143448378 [Clavelina lepadiformis]|uniref:uncharacterized protein LOC143448378 n=1 Tax=Clavelina lepadiformis TaxID=159417 RepID=UPI004041D8DC